MEAFVVLIPSGTHAGVKQKNVNVIRSQLLQKTINVRLRLVGRPGVGLGEDGHLFARNLLQGDLDGVMGAVGISGVPEENAFVVGRTSACPQPRQLRAPEADWSFARRRKCRCRLPIRDTLILAGPSSITSVARRMGALFSAQPASSGKAAAAPKASDRPRNSRRLIFIVFFVFLVCGLRLEYLPASAGEPQLHFASELGGIGFSGLLHRLEVQAMHRHPRPIQGVLRAGAGRFQFGQNLRHVLRQLAGRSSRPVAARANGS